MEQYGRLAEIYDEFMDEVDYDSWTNYICSLLKDGGVAPAARLLECGCGTGELSLRLKRAGFEITATDISDTMLARASEKARAAGLRMPFVRMDMRALAVHRPVSAIVACCDCVNYLASDEDASAFFGAAYASLTAGGALAFDISSRHKLKNLLGRSSFSDSRANAAYFWRNNYDEVSNLIEMELEFFVLSDARPALSQGADAGGLYERFFERHIQRAYTADEIIELMKRAGFSDIRVYDAFSLDPPRPDSERIQFFAVKSGG